MKSLNILTKLLPLVICLFAGTFLAAQGRVAGVITDEAGEALIGANIIVQGTTEGTITDFDGTFSFNTTQAFPLVVVASYTGYTTQEIELAAPTSDLSIKLVQGGILLGDDVVISASRKREKVQEAPASISVIGGRKLEATPQTDPVRQLVSTPGVQIQQQSAGRINIEMRASSGVFGTSVFPIKDYRSLVAPGLGVFQSDGAGLSNIDLARIEVVRGPGSALYGPGVTSGVVHFITKNPIDHPGTTVQLTGGELNTLGAALRHAGANASKTFGYKVNLTYNRGDEFKLDGSEGTTDAAGVFTRQIDKFRSTIVNPAISSTGHVDGTAAGTPLLTLTPDAIGNVMADDYKNLSAEVQLEFRPKDNLTFNLATGYNDASAVFYNDLGEGLAQSSQYFTQARMQAGGLFAQVFYLDNNGGSDDKPTYLYQTGNISPIGRKQLEGQLQYNFDMPSLLNANWTVGADYRSAINDTRNVTYGRNENIDDYKIFGAYAQGKFGLSDKFDLILAGRYDTFNFLDENFFSPRAALVYKASPTNTFRFSYNRAGAPPSTLETYIDFPVNVPVPGVLDFWLAGQKEVQNFGDNIEFINQNAVAQLAAGQVAQAAGISPEQALALLTGLADALPDQLPAGLLGTGGIPNELIHQVASGAVLQQLQAAGLSQLIPAVQGYLTQNAVAGSTGLFYGVNAFNNNSPLNELIPTNQSTITKSTTWELGYKGLIAQKFGVTWDIYRQTEQGFSDFTQIAPFITLQGADVSSFVNYAGGFAQFLVQAGVPAQSAQALAGVYGQTASIIPSFYGTGTVETDRVPQDGMTHVAAGYRIFPDAKATYFGSDLGVEYYATDVLSFFGNYSWLSKTEWRGAELGLEEDSPLSRYINSPKNKYRLGANYTPDYGFRANMVFQHDDSFYASVGQYTGDTDEKNLVDLGVGYKFENGLSLSVTGQNIFDNKYRAFVNMPQIGRRILGQITYDFGAEGPSDMDGDGIRDKKDACPNEPGTKEFRGCADTDGDGIIDKDDKCPGVAGDILYGGCPDSDGDGVIDSEDACPNVKGNLGGCPDADGDGVADKDDKCPNAAGPLNGCPDADNDGVADDEDACPNTLGTVGGCPDADGDGVADKDDKCPNTSARTADGCPADADGDGVVGAADKCPNAGGIVDANGCPKDSDGDGIADNDDKCPNIGGIVGPDGCKKPVPTKAVAVFDRALQGINFQSGRGVITRQSYAILNEVAAVMAEFPNLKVDIEGHTDSQGRDETNLRLSQKRAEAVQTYLIKKGVAASRLRAFGYGETRPIADNNTSAGRAQNRRVAFVATF